MKKEKSAFLMSYGWYDNIKKCSEKEKAMILDYAYAFHMGGALPTSDDRFINSIFDDMGRYFDHNKKQYVEKCIVNSLNQKQRWAKDDKNIEKENQIIEQKRYLKNHSIQEYMQVYGCIQNYTDYDNDNDCEYEIDNGNDSDYELEIE